MTSRSFVRSGEGAALVGALVLTDSLHYIFARWLTATFVPILSVALMMTIAAIEVGLFGLLSKNLSLRIGRRQIGILLVIACLVAFSSYASFLSVSYIDPGTAALLGKSGIVFSLGLSLLWLKERLGRGQVLGALLAIAGTFTIVAHPAEFVRLGSILVLLTALSYSFHAAITKRYLGDDFAFIHVRFRRVSLAHGYRVADAAAGGDAQRQPRPGGLLPDLEAHQHEYPRHAFDSQPGGYHRLGAAYV